MEIAKLPCARLAQGIWDNRTAEQDALFQIRGPDEDGCVWICSSKGRDDWCRNLGPAEKVVELLSQWIASIDDGESGFTQQSQPRTGDTSNPPLPDNHAQAKRHPFTDENDLGR
jgi:hypothetical protein